MPLSLSPPPFQAFEEVFEENPDVMIRVIQVIMIRLQRVLFTALRNYLGLNAELVQNHMRSKGSVIPGATTTAATTAAGTIMSQSSQSSRSVATSRTPVSPALRLSREEHTLSDPDPNPNANALLFAEVHGDAPYIDLYHHQQQQHQQTSATVAAGTGATSRCESMTINSESLNVPSNASTTSPTSIDQRLVHSSAVDSLRRELGLSEEDAHIIDPFVEVRELDANVTLILEGNADDVCVWFVMTGSLAVYQSNADATRAAKQDNRSDMLIHFVHPGEIVGGLAMLTGEASAYTIRARSSSRVAYIRRAAIYQ